MQAIEAKHGLKAYDGAKGNKEAIYELVRCCSFRKFLRVVESPDLPSPPIQRKG